jgi:transcriptional regulator with XRE-family HTH domain
MGKHLAEEIKKYRRRERENNRYIFENGMSQGKLADEIGVDRATFSRVVNGTRQPSADELEAFCEVLQLQGNQRDELFNALRKDRLELHDLVYAPLDSSAGKLDLELIDNIIDLIYRSRTRGEAKETIQKVDNIFLLLTAKVRQYEGTSYQKQLFGKQAQLLFEQGWALKEILPASTLLSGTWDIVTSLRELAYETQDEFFNGLADFYHGDTLYILKDYEDAARVLQRAMKSVDEPHNRLWLLRTLAVVYGYLKEKSALREVSQEAQNLIQSGKITKLEVKSLALEGIGRAQGMLRQEQGWYSLEEALNIYHEIEREGRAVPIRKVQIVRSQLVVANHIASTDKSFLEKVGGEGTELARFYGYQRIADQITKLMEEILNGRTRRITTGKF